MDKIYFDELNKLKINDMLGSESILCDCLYQNKPYLYKQPTSFNDEVAEKILNLSQISNSYLVIPKYIIYGNNYHKPIGYLLDYLKNYKSFYDLNITKDEKILLLKKMKQAIIAMHNLGIIHSDLHLANMMYFKKDVKIIDFDSSKFQDYRPFNYNFYTKRYLEDNSFDIGVDIFNFNIDTFSCLNNVAWDNVFKFDFSFKMTNEQKKVWQKTKERKKLTYDDFLIDRY